MTAVLLAALGALLVGAALGWLFASRHGVAELAAGKVHAEQHDLTRKLLVEVTGERDAAMRALDSQQAAASEREIAFEARLA